MGEGDWLLWGQKYRLGIEEIDRQHQQWLLISEKLVDALMVGGERGCLGSILQELFAYTRYHFSYEEQALEQSGYPNLEQHKKLHAELVRQLELMREKIAQLDLESTEQTVPPEALELAQLCRNWLIEHIEQEDKEYAPYLRHSN